MKTLKQQVYDGHIVAGWHKLSMALALEPVPGDCQACSASTRDRKSFCATTYQEALEMADIGWDEGARAAEKHPEYVELFATAQQRTTMFGWDDTEGELSAERLLSGSDFYLRKSKRAIRDSRGCRILVSASASCGIDQDALLQRAIDIAAGVWQLELAKHSVEVWMIQTSSDVTHSVALKVHESGQTINLAKMAFWCGHPAVLRRLIFGLMERTDPKIQRKLGGAAYGMPDGLSSRHLAKLDLPPWQGDTVLLNTIRSNDVARNRRDIVAGFHKALQRLDDSTCEDSGVIQVGDSY